jgi:hypothetical protein
MQLTYYEACRRIRKFSNGARDDTKDGKNVGLKLKHWSKVPAKTSKARDGEDEEMATSGEYTTQTLLVDGMFESVLTHSADAEEMPLSLSDEEAEDEGRYPFAKYTVQGPTVYSYTDEEYTAHCEGAFQFPNLSYWREDLSCLQIPQSQVGQRTKRIISLNCFRSTMLGFTLSSIAMSMPVSDTITVNDRVLMIWVRHTGESTHKARDRRPQGSLL